MANDTAQWLGLAEVIYQYIDQAKLTTAEFRRLWSIGVRGVEELGMDVHSTPKTVKLVVNANKTVNLPSDYIGFSKVGIFNSDGEIATLRRNPSLTAYKIDQNDRLTSNIDNVQSNSYRLQDLAFINYFDGARFVNIFGAGALLNSAGEFDISEDEGILYLDNNFPYDYVVMEYLSSPADDVDYNIPIQVRDAVLSYIAWKDIEMLPSGRRVNMGEKQLRRKEFYNQKRLARLRVNPVTPWDANEVIRMGQKLVAKA
jgi:hypothetical protein